MKTILLIGSSMLLFQSCIELSDTEPVEVLSDEAMKARVEVEEIDFEIDSADKITSQEIEPEQYREIPRQWEDMDDNPERDSEKEIVPPSKPRPEPPPYPFSRYVDYDQDASIDAQYPGGVQEMKAFIAQNLRYPNGDICVQGRVYVAFVVEKDGCITNAQVMRGVSKELDNEALRVVRSMPKWIPAQNNGKVVAVKVRLPIRFELD